MLPDWLQIFFVRILDLYYAASLPVLVLLFTLIELAKTPTVII